VEGVFDQTVPEFVKQHHDEKVAFFHIDCDLYSSTQTIFEHFAPMFTDGTIIAFDELINYGGELWKQHEYKAFVEFIDKSIFNFEVLSKNGAHQVTVRIWRG
jgi:hypothetical protein